MGVSPKENFEKSLSVVLFDIINNVSGGIRWGLKSTSAIHYKKVFWGVEILYRGFNTSTSPLKYSPGGRPL